MFSNVINFRERYQHAYNKIKWHIPDHVKGGKFLDVGCGTGNGVAAAAAHGASMSVGIDRSFREFGHEFCVEEFQLLCEAVGSKTDSALLVEGNIFDIKLPFPGFDYAMMLDSAEHVPDLARILKWTHESLRRGGFFLLDTCPLFYSPVGSHLWHWFPETTDPWAHLKPGFEQRCHESGIDEWSMERYRELNKVTHQEILDTCVNIGFEIVEEHRSTISPEREELFRRYGSDIDLSVIQKEWLFEDWILLVGRKI